ncbi:hypothetical protein DMN91_007144 [Ooceraea biroi]|uniref:Uncharacterized protein n=1 Tax=Ooceraea biroi TaxID=2015173 RepID=A0A026W7F7_OOCBI|nr:uncharacterized protein LOC105282383 isoform X1 [Ooceraea biroi]EZA51928.1 hypothetical protein X777_09243 [Ooceraea biroi]RLU20534.1 hypothetical protein DMN91_007144 [Ooceraea biroi]
MISSRILITVLMALLLHSDTIMSFAEPTYKFLHDFIQYNVAGIPLIHQSTEWDFNPEVGKQRRIRYEQENGRFGEHAIAKLGMGIGYKGSWGKSVQN